MDQLPRNSKGTLEKPKEKSKPKKESRDTDPFIHTGGIDDWDESLLPSELIEEVWREQFSPTHSSSSSSEEPYDHFTESGTAVTLLRKKRHGSNTTGYTDDEEEEELIQVPSLSDVEGGVPKSTLKQMKIEEIEHSLLELEDAMNFVLAENVIFERTIGRMEQRDREIEGAMPIFTYKYPWEVEGDENENGSEDGTSSDSNCDDDEDNPGGEGGDEDEFGSYEEEEKRKRKKKKQPKKINPMIGSDGKIREICDWADSDDEEFTGTYEGIQPTKEISVSTDKFFEGMPIQDKYAIRNYIRSFGDLAPANYDYMRHKYQKLVQISYQATESVANEEIQENYDDEVREHQKIFDEAEGLGDEDPEFPGFFPRSAKRLPLEYKHKYAEEEEEILAKDIATEQTKSYRRENSIQVLIDTNIDVFELLSNLNDEFTEVLKNAHHPLTKKLMAEKIIQFRKTIRSKILAEETKITMSLVELQKVRKKVNEQLKTQQEMGFKLQKIDFEQIRIRNNEYTNRIEKAHTELKGLKLLTAGCFQILKEQRQKLNKKIRQHSRMVDDIELRETLMIAFQADLQKYTQILNEVQQKNNFMRKRIRAFKVPNSMEYIRFKAIQLGLEEEVSAMRKKLRSLKLSKASQQSTLESLTKGLPLGSLKSLNDNDEWLEEMKKHVHEKGLLSILTQDELNNIHPEKEKKRQLGDTPRLKNYLLIPRRDGKKDPKGKQFVPAPKRVRDLYDPEDDQKSTTDVAKMQTNHFRMKRLTFNRLYENKQSLVKKPAIPEDGKTAEERRRNPKCGDKRYRRGVRGNIILDMRDHKLTNVAQC